MGAFFPKDRGGEHICQKPLETRKHNTTFMLNDVNKIYLLVGEKYFLNILTENFENLMMAHVRCGRTVIFIVKT